ncbi:MAG TPA: alkaline phosphatase PafA [Chitinophagaceae bacterium]|nr:alkaline phosphatase PafA [Chitinophagaceae bacterium]
MRGASLFLLAIAITTVSYSQNLQRPKLVVGIVVDQMRWDFLYRYYDRYSANGFKKLLTQGFSCENTLIPYVPTVTACGHASIYTGSVPAINGITGNFWWDHEFNRSMYCTEDSLVKTVGSNTTYGLQSPKNLLTNTICDELKLATNFRSKVIGIALKDRGSILPAGHSADAAYWYDIKTGDWISSTYYLKDLPQWVKAFNAQKLVDKYYKEGWATLYPLNTYIQSTADEKPYEGKVFGADAKGFPYNLNRFAANNYGIIASTPFGNTLTAELAKAAITNEQLGANNVTDFLAVSFSSTDYVGHSFGPNSVETEDTYLRLDKELGDLLNFIDSKVGKDQYIVFLSADHGAAHVPEFAKENKMPGGNVNLPALYNKLNESLKLKFGKDGMVADISNYQVSLNLPIIQPSQMNEIKNSVIDFLSRQPGIARAFATDQLSNTPMPAKQKEMFANGYYPTRSGEIQMIFKSQWIEGFLNGGTTHGVWNPYDAHIPLLWYGWNIKTGKTNRETYMTDIAATLAALLHIQMPNGCVGTVIQEVFK